ncbi:MAG: DinB family protein [Thermomicrobiales bacterium]|nr:DinB family protein [Thermomicrobiales bacterium]
MGGRAARDKQIADYEAGYDQIVAAIDGLDDAGLDVREAPSEWSPREVIHHLADSEMTSAIRLRRLLAEDRPLLVGYDQEEFARRLHYDRPIAASMAAFKAARESTADILHRLTEDEWAREGTHSESGRYTVLEWLGYYALHAHEHADQIRRARAANGV